MLLCEICNFCNSGVPSPLVIISDPFGSSAYEFIVSWRKPETGGMPIVEYRFYLRKVTDFSYSCTTVVLRAENVASQQERVNRI